MFNKSIKKIKLTNKIIFVFLFILASYFVFQFFIPASFVGEKIILDVPPNSRFYKVAEQMEDQGLIRNSFYLKVLIRTFGTGPLHVGEYELSPSESLVKQFLKIRSGKVYYKFVSFPEGFNHYEMAQTLKQQGFVQHENFLKLIFDKKFIYKMLGQNLHSLEGYLFPETYPINKYTSAEEFIGLMIKNFLTNYERARVNAKKGLQFSRHQALTFASLIEKETSVTDEAPIVASVFYNRLDKNMKLQTDPTILYSMYLKSGFATEKNIRKKDILMPSEYNTYVIKGLPKGPIANPGFKSLQAVFQPAQTDYFYFVSRNNGSHDFSKTYEEHNRKVYEYQIKPFKNQK